jgi:hypothetical protein
MALLAELAAALNRRGMYPPGHPALAEAAARMAERAEAPLRAHGDIVLAVTRDRIYHDDHATDPAQPMMRDLAERLHRRHVGSLRLQPGFDERQAGALLDVLAPEPDDDDTGPAPWREESCSLLPVRYDRLALAEGDVDGAARRVWSELARSALGADAEGAPTPGALALAINARSGDESRDRALSQRLGHLLRAGVGEASTELAPEIADLLRQLDPERLRRLLELGGDRQELAKLLSEALDALPADAVLALLKAARGREQSISDSLLRILGKLAAQGGDGRTDAVQPEVDAALRGQVEQLVAGWQLSDPNPEAYTEALQSLAARRQGRPAVADEAHRPEALAIVRMAFELGATGPGFDRALQQSLASAPAGLVELLQGAPRAGGANAAVDEAWSRLLDPRTLARLLKSSAPGSPDIERVLEEAGEAAVDPLLDRLAESEDRGERRWLLDRLAALGDAAVGPPATARLEDAPWFLARNILTLLRRTGGGDRVAPEPYLGHEDPRVRVEAVRLFGQGSAPARDGAILAALSDADPSVVSAGLAVAAEGCPAAALPLLADRSLDHALADDVRAQAIRLTADHPTDSGRDALIRLSVRGRTLLLRRLKFADPSPLVLAALSSLVRGWPEDPEVAEIREAAAHAKHGGIRAAVRSAAG